MVYRCKDTVFVGISQFISAKYVKISQFILQNMYGFSNFPIKATNDDNEQR